MELVLDEDHEMAQRAARDFVSARSSLRRVRGLRETGGLDRGLWGEMARLGWLGLTIPEAHGGSAAGHVYTMLVLEELGRGLMPEPYLGTVLLGAAAIARAGDMAQQGAHLPAVAAGERLLALAYEEAGTRFDWRRGATRAEPRAGGGWALHGEKIRVLGGATADLLVVLANAPAGPSLFLVRPADARVERQHLLDGRDAALVRLEASPAEPLGAPGGAEAVLDAVLDAATLGLTAEMLGAMSAAFEMTLAYLKTRVQFGAVIGTFQALQHRAARLYMEQELARAAVWSGHALLDAGAGPGEIALAASIAKARCSDAFLLIAHEAVQMHGGIGMTDEHDIGLYLKRARVAEMTFGDAGHHRDRFARLRGF